MKLLFDQNISYRILKLIEVEFPETEQIRRLGLENKSDRDIWNFAKQNTGNNTTLSISQQLLYKKELINEFIKQAEFSCLEIQ